MKKLSFPASFLFFACLLAVSLAGCGSGGDDNTVPPSPDRYTSLDMAGTWTITGISVADPNRGNLYGYAEFYSNGNFLRGEYSYMPDYEIGGLAFSTFNISLDGITGVASGTIRTRDTFSFDIDNGKMDPTKYCLVYTEAANIGRVEKDLAIAFKQGGIFSGSDMNGTWHLLGLSTVELLAALRSGSLYGTITVANSGTLITGELSQNGEAANNISNGILSIDSEGIFRSGGGNFLWVTSVGQMPVSYGKMDYSKTFGSFTSYYSTGGEKNLVLFIKETGTFTQADLSGTWYISGAVAGAAVNGTIAGTVEVGSAGALTGGTLALPGDVDRNITGGTLSVGASGDLTGTVKTAAGDIVVQSGRLDASKKKLAFTDSTNKRLFVLLK